MIERTYRTVCSEKKNGMKKERIEKRDGLIAQQGNIAPTSEVPEDADREKSASQHDLRTKKRQGVRRSRPPRETPQGKQKGDTLIIEFNHLEVC